MRHVLNATTILLALLCAGPAGAACTADATNTFRICDGFVSRLFVFSAAPGIAVNGGAALRLDSGTSGVNCTLANVETIGGGGSNNYFVLPTTNQRYFEIYQQLLFAAGSFTPVEVWLPNGGLCVIANVNLRLN